ncbi:MAG TPA: tetratricopeptide repeat protein [Steroidobacteraceae bacterium]|jgi:predicted O-linked N-acetylglucosamine transferase (SPINDLY family)|nr:tetratricopeptide repeat protein [Steroidobacteraceae bacterium]
MTNDVTAQVEAALRQAHALHQAGRPDEARALCLQALRLRPHQLQATTLLGIIAAQTGDLARAVALFGEVLLLDPGNVAAHNNQGNALRALRQPAAAVASYDKALEIQPHYAPTHNSRGKALFDLQRYEDALAGHDRAIALQPDYAAAYFDRGRALVELMRYEAALASLDEAIALGPNHPGAWYLRGNALYSLERFQEAAASYDRTIALQPNGASARHNRGNALFMLGQYEGAIASYDQAIALDPDIATSHGERLHARMQIADWRDFAPEVARLAARIEHGEAASNPFVLLASSDSPPLQKLAARNWVRHKCPASGAPAALPARPRSDRIRVGYFSADFRAHATSSLTAGLFETHDRSRLELTGFSFGPDTGDEMRRRVAAAFDRFVDVRQQSDHDIARLARSLSIDIAVDLNGFTRGGRPGIFALRAAPLQVSYLGYLGTMSADYMDYLIADDTIVPQAQRPHYAEKIVYLPSYQVNDSGRRIAPRQFTRQELGLPHQGFVFCCLNSTYKLTPDTFDGWMRILAAVPGSVLYLLGGSGPLESNLRRETRARGVAAERIVFGERLPAPEYLARYRAADLFLDTLPYNAGTTASDALWAGLPVLTCMGATFAGRVGASLLRAVGMPELIASSPQQYEQLAIDLASNPQRLAGLRARLADGLRTAPLFDTAASARHLEAAYAGMYDRYHAGLPPEHIRVET